MFSRKGALPALKVILILFTSTIILTSFALFYLKSHTIQIDNSKPITLLATKNILSNNCFSNTYDTIDKDKFTNEMLNNCFKNFNESILMKVSILDFNSKKPISNNLYLGEKSGSIKIKTEFGEKAKLCSLFSQVNSIYCVSQIIPITYNDGSSKVELLEIDTIY